MILEVNDTGDTFGLNRDETNSKPTDTEDSLVDDTEPEKEGMKIESLRYSRKNQNPPKHLV